MLFFIADYFVMLIGLIVVVLLIFLYFKFVVKFKFLKYGCLVLFTGGVKCGKSTVSVDTVFKEYRKRLFVYKFKCFILKIFNRKKIISLEKPLLYSNVPLACDYVQLTREHILRQIRFNYGSVVYIQEASLMADSMLIKDMDINKELQLFVKLFGHETKGGCLILDTQSLSDNHYAVKRGINSYFYVHHLIKWVPFVLIAKVREMYHSEDDNVVNVYNDDVEQSLKTIVISKRIWKKFDSYSFSSLTDNLPLNNVVVHNKNGDLKVKKLVSFRREFNFDVDSVNNLKGGSSNA